MKNINKPLTPNTKQPIENPFSTEPDPYSTEINEFPFYGANRVDSSTNLELINRQSPYDSLGSNRVPNLPKINQSSSRVPGGVGSKRRVVAKATIDNAYDAIQKLADQSIYVIMDRSDHQKITTQITTLTASISEAQKIYNELLSSARFIADLDYHLLKTKQHNSELLGEQGSEVIDAKARSLKIDQNPHLKHLQGVIRKAQIMSYYVGGSVNKSQEKSNQLLGQLEENLLILSTDKTPISSDKSWYVNTVYKGMAQFLGMHSSNDSNNIDLFRKSLMEMEIIQKYGHQAMRNPEWVEGFNKMVEESNEKLLAKQPRELKDGKTSAKNRHQKIQQTNNSDELESLKARLAQLEEDNLRLQNQNGELEELLRRERLKVGQEEQEDAVTISDLKKRLGDQKAKLLEDFNYQTAALRQEITDKTAQVNSLSVKLARLEVKQVESQAFEKRVLLPQISTRIFPIAKVNTSNAETQTNLSKELSGVEVGINTVEDDIVFEKEEQTDFSHIKAENEIPENASSKKIMTADAITQTTPHFLTKEDFNQSLRRFVGKDGQVHENKFRHALWKVVEHNKTLSVNDSNSFEEFWNDITNLSRPDKIAITEFALNTNVKVATEPEDIKQVFTVINQFIEIMGKEGITEYLKGFRDENGAIINQVKTGMPITIISDEDNDKGKRPANPLFYPTQTIGKQLQAVFLSGKSPTS